MNMPNLEYSILEYTVSDLSKVDKMRLLIIDNEKNIVEKYKKNTEGDGGTGLGENSQLHNIIITILLHVKPIVQRIT